MKFRLLFLTLALAAVFAFTACGGRDAKTSSASESSKTESETEKETAEEPEAKSQEKSEAESEAPEAASESTEDKEEPEPAAEDPSGLKAGKYNLVGMVQDGGTIATKDLVTMADLGFEMYIDLKEDGTGELNMYGESVEITWDDKGITSQEQEIPYEWDGRYLVLTEGDTSITFSLLTAQEVIDAGDGVEGTMSFFEEDDKKDESAAEPTAAVEIVGADWVKNYEDKDILVVWFDMTNISDDYISASWDAYTTVIQDEAEVEYGYVDSADVAETENVYRSIRPGVTIRCANTFAANKDGGPIEYKVTSGYYDAEILTAEFDPAALPGAPKEAFEQEKITDIDWLDGAAESGVYEDSAEVAFKNYEVVDGYNDRKVLRVWITYKNTGDEAASFFMAASLRAVQDGMTLSAGYTALDDENADLKDKDVEPGESLDICMDYELISDSPVAVEFVTYGDEEKIAKVCDVK